MPVEIRVTSQKFYSQLSDFDADPTDFTPNLQGGRDESIKAIFRIQIGIWSELKSWSWQKYDSDTRARLVMVGGNFTELFSATDTIELVSSDNSKGCTAVIEDVDDDWIDLVSLTAGGILNALPINNTSSDPLNGTQGNTSWLINTTDLTGCEYKVGIIENDETANFNSKLTGTEQMYRFEGIPTTSGGGTVAGVTAGNNKAWVSGGATIEFIDDVTDVILSRIGTTWKEYEIIHNFDILPLSTDDDEIGVPPEDLEGTKSLKYIFRPSFKRTIQDPNSNLAKTWDTTKGSVGDFGESFNGFPSPYTSGNVVYTDITEGGIIDSIFVGHTTRATFSLFDSSNSFQTGDAVVMAHSAILTSDQYERSVNDQPTTWTKRSTRTTVDAAPLTDDFIQLLDVNFVNSGQLDVTVDFLFSALQSAELEEGQPYKLFATLQKSGATALTGSRTQVLIDENEYIKSADIEGLFDVTDLVQFPHPKTFIDTATSAGYTNAKVNIEENLLCVGSFWVNNAESAILESISFQISAYNTVTGERGILRNVNFDLSDQVVINGVQKIEQNDTRGYLLKDGNQFNKLILTTKEKIGDKQYYEVQVGYKIPWQEWNEFLQADTVFYDTTKDHDGLNEKSDKYSKQSNPTLPTGGTNDYVIRAFIVANVSKDGISTTYDKGTGDIEVYGYDDNGGESPEYTCDIKTYNEDNIELENKIIQDGYTKFQAVVTPDVPPVFTETINFSNIINTWGRYAWGNRFIRSDNKFYRVDPDHTTLLDNAGFDNQQADSNDVFTGFDLDPILNKLSNDLYDTPIIGDKILSEANMGAFYGLYSEDKFESYSITGKMFADSGAIDDNDIIAYQIAFLIDDFGVEHSLSVAATTGGQLLKLREAGDSSDPAYDINADNIQNDIFSGSGLVSPFNQVNIGLVYNLGKNDWALLDSDYSGVTGKNWADVGDLTFTVDRQGNDVTVITSWDLLGDGTFAKTFNYTLGEDPQTTKFIGAQYIGFGFQSQDQGGFKDVDITIPSGDYWSVLRSQPQLSPSDSSMSELSTVREASEGNFITQTTGDEVLADFVFVDGSFFISGLFDTTQIQQGEKYKLSVEIGSNNLGDQDLLVSYAYVEPSNLDLLIVKFNIDVNITDLTGITLGGTGVTVSSIDSGDGTNFLLFNLSGDLSEGATFEYSGGSNIQSVVDSQSLGVSSQTILII